MNKLGFVDSEDGRNFALRPRILALGHAYLGSTPLARAGQPVLRHVSSSVNESSSIAILDGDEILYIARAFTSRIMTVDLDIGSRLPAVCTSMGRAMLSRLPAAEQSQLLDRARLVQHTPHTIVERTALKRNWRGWRSRAMPSSTRNWKSACAPLPCPSSPPMAVPRPRSMSAYRPRASAARNLLLRVLPVLREAAEELALLSG